MPPCEGASPFPAYVEPGRTPNYRVWSERDPGQHWAPPRCTGWMPRDGVLVAVAGQFRYGGNIAGLLARFGRISALRGLRYWSVTENGWETLITDASALVGQEPAKPRSDFTAAEMETDADLYFTETDNRSTQPVIYRMHATVTSEKILVSVENVTPVRVFMFTMFSPGDLQSVHYLARAAPGIWSYYGLARTGVAPSSLLEPKEVSYLNRALAFYSLFTKTPLRPIQR